MKKKIIFFDGDGTLWYPRKTKYVRHPVWLYRDKRFKNHNNHIMMIPSVVSTLRKLKKEGILTIILSTHPHPPEEAKVIINEKIRHFRLEKLFDEVHATKPYPESKGEFILRILKERKIPKSRALMVGDSYNWDYLAAKRVGVDAILITSNYESMKSKARKKISKLSDLWKLLSKG